MTNQRVLHLLSSQATVASLRDGSEPNCQNGPDRKQVTKRRQIGEFPMRLELASGFTDAETDRRRQKEKDPYFVHV